MYISFLSVFSTEGEHLGPYFGYQRLGVMIYMFLYRLHISSSDICQFLGQQAIHNRICVSLSALELDICGIAQASREVFFFRIAVKWERYLLLFGSPHGVAYLIIA